MVMFDVDDFDAAIAELDARYARRRSGRPFRDLVGDCRGIRRAQSR